MRRSIFFCIGLLCLFSCKSPEARRPVSKSSGSYIEKSVERNKKIVAEEEEVIRQIMKEDSTRTYHSSPHGFWYYYNQKDTSTTKTPDFGDVVVFDHSMETLDGRPIYTDEELPQRTYVMDQEELFSGLREGLKLMREGETVTFLFPSHKAYGFYGDKDRIGSNFPIRSTVTLHKITSKNPNQNQD